MKNYILYKPNGKIMQTGHCQDNMVAAQAYDDLVAMEGTANSITQKIVDGKVVDKTLEEIESEKLPEAPFEKRQAHINNEQLQSLLNRIEKLESKN